MEYLITIQKRYLGCNLHIPVHDSLLPIAEQARLVRLLGGPCSCPQRSLRPTFVALTVVLTTNRASHGTVSNLFNDFTHPSVGEYF